MIKRIPVEQLKIGMYVHSLNLGWLDHPFVRSRFRLDEPAQLQRIRELGLREVDIDTALGPDVPRAPSLREVAEDLTPALEEAARQPPPALRPTSLLEERVRAGRIQREASRVAAQIMEDARLGRQIELDPARALIQQTVTSIVRNQDALIGLNRIRCVDRYTFEHSINVSVLMIAFGRALGLESAAIEGLGLGALLHDIGKIRVPDAILNKPGRLTDPEIEVIRRHVDDGHELLSQTPGMPAIALEVLVEHHERMDGTGYPDGKTGAAISHFGQMAAIVDVYDALTTERVYHKALPPHLALRKLLEWSPHHFSTTLVQQFIRCVGIYPIGTLVRLESGRLAVVVESGRTETLKPVVRLVLDTVRRRRLLPRDLDLARPTPEGRDSILHAEDPAKWGIDPGLVLSQTPAAG